MKTRREYLEFMKTLTDSPDLIEVCNKEIEKIDRQEVQVQLNALSKLTDRVDIEIVKKLKNNLKQFALENLTNL